MIINGREYRMWGGFIERKNQFIGGILEEIGCSETTIKDITLEPNGEDSAYFTVIGEEFSCGFDVHYGGITYGEDGWLTFQGYGGHSWRIKEKEK